MLGSGTLRGLWIIYAVCCVRAAPVWGDGRRRWRGGGREVRRPLFAIFKRGVLGNTLGACWFMASAFVTFYSINSLFAAHLQADLHMSPALIATPIAIANLLAFIASASCGWVSEHIGRRWATILP